MEKISGRMEISCDSVGEGQAFPAGGPHSQNLSKTRVKVWRLSQDTKYRVIRVVTIS